jgi:ketosteroid isomerase-like protein
MEASSVQKSSLPHTEDAVFMVPNNPSAVGKVAVRQAYDAVFKAIRLKVKFTVDELVEMAPQWCADQFRRYPDDQRHRRD